MSIDLPFFKDEHRMLREMVAEFSDEVLAPRARELDESGEFPWDNFKAMAELGLTGIHIPEEYGGMGMDLTAFAIAMEEIARGCGSTALTLAAHLSLCCYPIYRFGTEEQKQKYLPKLCSGEWLGAFGLSEPQAGSDAAATQTRAVREGDYYVINGTKMWMTNGGNADVMVITAKTSDAPGTKGITSFILEKGFPGITHGKDEDKLGLRASQTSQIFLEKVKVPVENRLGEEGEGFKNFMTTLDSGRVIIGAMAVGLARAAFERALKYAKERSAFGRPIAGFDTIRDYLAEMATRIEASQLLVYHAAYLRDQGEKATKECAMAKYFASENALWVCHKAIQIHGGYGYTKEYEVERIYRDAKLCTIGEGTSEIQRLVIGREVIGELPQFKEMEGVA